MRLLLPILLFFAIVSCTTKNNAQHLAQNDSIVDDSTIYQFVNEVMQTTSPGGILVDKRSVATDLGGLDSVTLKSLDSVINAEDFASMQMQNKRSIDYRYKQKFIKNMKLLPYETLDTMLKAGVDTFWENFYAKYGRGFCRISMPLFSRDRKTVIVDIGYSCGGLCGSGGIYVFRKINNKWVQIRELSTWIS